MVVVFWSRSLEESIVGESQLLLVGAVSGPEPEPAVEGCTLSSGALWPSLSSSLDLTSKLRAVPEQ
jgi:hypothetical protein